MSESEVSTIIEREQGGTLYTESKSLVKQVPFILLGSLFIISVAAAAFLFIQQGKTVNSQSAQLISQADAIAKANAKTTDLEGKLKDSVAQFEDIKQLSALGLLQHDIEGGVVTDDFVVQKISLYPKDNAYSILIDLSTQPPMYASYKGKGAFSITDRELRAKGTDVINKVKEYYTKNKLDKMPAWDKNKVFLTIQNYDIGEVKDGELKLVGEK